MLVRGDARPLISATPARGLVRWANPLGLGLTVLGAVIIGWAVWVVHVENAALDFHSYAVSAQRWLAGGPMYLPEQHRPYELTSVAGRGFVYPPTAMLILLPVVAIGPTLFTAASAIALVAGLAAVARDRLSPLSLGLITVLCAFSTPFIRAIGVGSVTMALTAALAFAYAFRGAAAAGALALLVKLAPGAIAGVDGARGIARAAAIAGVVAVVTLPIVGADAWRSFADALSNGYPDCGDRAVSIACIAAPTIGMSAAKLLSLAIGAGMVLACIPVHGRLARLALVTAALYATATEFTSTGQYVVYLYPLIVAAVARIPTPAEARRPTPKDRPSVRA